MTATAAAVAAPVSSEAAAPVSEDGVSEDAKVNGDGVATSATDAATNVAVADGAQTSGSAEAKTEESKDPHEGIEPLQAPRDGKEETHAPLDAEHHGIEPLKAEHHA